MKTCLNCLEKLEIKAYIESPAQGLLPCCAGDGWGRESSDGGSSPAATERLLISIRRILRRTGLLYGHRQGH